MDHIKAQEALTKLRNEEFAKAKPSKVLRMALEDWAAIVKDSKYRVHMPDWVNTYYSAYAEREICSVCFGGAVLANRFKMNSFSGDIKELHEIFTDHSTDVAYRIFSLNEFRAGAYLTALNAYYPEKTPGVRELTCNEEFIYGLVRLQQKHVNYGDDSAQFKQCMENLASFLETWGI